MSDLPLPDLADPVWRAVRATAVDAVRMAARKGQASARVHGVQLDALRLGAPRALSPWAFVRLTVQRGTAPGEVTFVSAQPEDRGHAA